MEKIAEFIKEFALLLGELVILFCVISFIVAILQIYISKDKIRQILTRKYKFQNAIFGALLGGITPFCSCSTIPLLLGLLKANAPFCGVVSYLIASPILNPAIIFMIFYFFGLKASVIYFLSTFLFSICAGLILDKFGFEKEIKNVILQGEFSEKTIKNLSGSFWQKQIEIFKLAFILAFDLFKRIFLFLFIGAFIGAIIHNFVPNEFFDFLSHINDTLAICVATIIGIPMYIRAESMLPIGIALMQKGVGLGIIIALIIGGAGASIPELILLSSIFRKKMLIAFLICLFFVAVMTGIIFNLLF